MGTDKIMPSVLISRETFLVYNSWEYNCMHI
jgi:hypothetical protein